MSTKRKFINKLIKNKESGKNKTKKKKIIGSSIDYYNLRYSGTKLLPRTSILIYIYKNHYDYLKLRELREKENKAPFSLSNFFKLENFLDNIGKEKEVNVNVTIKGKYNLYKFISDCVYSTQLSFFEPDKNVKSIINYINRFKYQVGKDLPRNKVKINDVNIDSTEFANIENYYARTDKYVNLLLEKYYKIDKKIDYNKINLFLTITTQNILNAMVNLIISDLTSRFSKDFSILIVGADLGLDIVITQLKEHAIWNFSSNILISNIGEISPEFPCGKIQYKLLLDIKKRTFEFLEFKFSYDLNNCQTYNDNNKIIEQSNIQNESSPKTRLMDMKFNNETLLYGIPTAISAAGIISTPFILGVLGGNKKRKRKNTTRRVLKFRK